jgi:hypothetical protein
MERGHGMSKMNEARLRQSLELLAGMEPSPPAARRALDRVRQSILNNESPPVRPNFWRIITGNKWGRLGVAAAILAVGIGLNVFTPWGGGVAWSHVLEHVRQARSCTHRMQWTISRAGQPDTQYDFIMYRSADYGIRRDAYQEGRLVSQLFISDNAENCVEVVPAEKKYVKVTLTEPQLAEIREKSDPRELTKLFMNSHYRPLGSREVEHRRCEGIEVDDPNFTTALFEKGTGRLWADVATDLPVRMELEGTSAGGAIRMHIVLDKFQWDPGLTHVDFEPNIPEDYGVLAEVDLSPGERTIVKALESFASITGGRYPSSLNIMTAMSEVQAAFIAERRKRGISLEEKPTKEELSNILAIQGTCMYYGRLLNDGNDVAYHGDRVTAEFPHAVLMRWKCAADTYRVILGDLTVQDIPAARLQALEAKPLNSWPYAIHPAPAEGTVGVALEGLQLKWLPGAKAVEHRLYFGTDPNRLPLLATVKEPSFEGLPALERNTTYFWYVDEVEADGSVTPGNPWSVSTGRLVGWWKLDESKGDTVADATGSHAGKLVGDATWTEGVAGGALQFDGQGDYVDLGTSPDFDIADRITIAAWVKVTAFDMDWQAIIAKGDTAWRLSRDQDNNLHFGCTGLWPEWVRGNVDVNDGRWHHVAGSYDGSELRLYVDGKLDASARTQGAINVNAYPVYIGENAEHPGRSWHGLIDDVRLYNYALSETEIRSLDQAQTQPN